MSATRFLPVALLFPALLLAGPGHDHGGGPHPSSKAAAGHSEGDGHGHGDDHGHAHEADSHGVTPSYGGEIFEAKGHHFEVALRGKTLLLVPRDPHSHDLAAVKGKLLIQIQGGAPLQRVLTPKNKTDALPAHFAATGDASALRQHGAKALVVLKGLPDAGKRGLSFWVHLEEHGDEHEGHDDEHKGHAHGAKGGHPPHGDEGGAGGHGDHDH